MHIIRIRRIVGLLSIFAVLLSGCACPGGKTFRSIDGERVDEIKSILSQMSAQELEKFAQDLNFAKEFLPQQIILKFKVGTSASKVDETLATIGAIQTHRFKSTQALLLKVPDAISPADILALVTALNEVESVEYAVPNGIIKLSALPNDPEYQQQDDLKNSGQRGGTPGADIRAEGAWKVTQGSPDVLVGVIDTGIDYRHPDLIQNIWTNPGETGTDIEGNDKALNGIDDDGNGYVDDVHGYDFVNNDSDPMDDHGHGTHVAGTIGATGNNGLGMTGIAWRVGLVPLKVFSADGTGSDAEAIQALEYATAMNIPITNNSWGGYAYNQALKDAIEANAQQGFLFIAAAGNESVDTDIVQFFPASYAVDNIISVAAVDNKDQKPDFSNWGARRVHIAAPGVNILSLAVTGSSEPLVRWSGTSMAAPHVAGAAALIKAAYPQSDYRQMKERILFGADRVPSLLSPTYTSQHFRPDNYPMDKPLVGGGRRLNLEASVELDSTAPGAIANLRIAFTGLTQLEVLFSKAGDDGTSGAATGYFAVISDSPITTEASWNLARKAELLHLVNAASDQVRGEVSDLEILQKGFITLRAIDNAGNLGPFSNSLAFEMTEPQELFKSDGESFEGITSVEPVSYTVPWEQEEVPGRGKVWSDSAGRLREGANHYMEFTQSITVTHPDMVLQFDSKLDCDAVWERAYVDYRINEETDPNTWHHVYNPERRAWDWYQAPRWRMLGLYSAPKCEWGKVTIPLRNKLKVGDKIRFRFWFRTFRVIEANRDGWLIDDIKVLGPGSVAKPAQFIAWRATESSPVILKWKDDSRGETHFEIQNGAGASFAAPVANATEFATGQNSVDGTLRIRACNGPVCSEWSDPVTLLPLPPEITSISPNAIPLAGGQKMTLVGKRFLPGAIIRVQGVDCPQATFVSDTQLTCVPSARSAGTYHVAVIHPDTQRAVLRSALTYNPAPTITSLSGAAGPLAGGNTLTVQGTGFLVGAIVRIQGIECANLRRLSDSYLTCNPGPRSAGAYNLGVINPDGQRAVVHGGYRYQAAPEVNSLSPTLGRTAGGERLTLRGSGFLSGARVQVGYEICLSVAVISSQEIQCTAPPTSDATHPIQVINGDGQASIIHPGAFYRTATPRWVKTNGESCSAVCSVERLRSAPSPEGAVCSSGKVIPRSAVGQISFSYGCSPNKRCVAQGRMPSTQVDKFCYGTNQRRLREKTDLTMGCYCDL